MSVGCLVITTNLPHRLDWTFRLLDSIQSADHGVLSTKVLSVDLQPSLGFLRTEGCESYLRDWCQEHGWQIVMGECTGERAMVNNIARGLAYIDTDFLFYCEDHVVIEEIPPEWVIQDLWDRIGINWINYNTHIHQENLLGIPGFVERPGKEQRLAYVNDPEHWIETDHGDFLMKFPEIRDEYNLCFPAAIMPTLHFRKMLEYGLEHYSGIGIEIGFTRAWDDLMLDYASQTAIYTKVGTKDILPLGSFHDLHMRACMRFRNNDSTMLHDSVVPHVDMPKEKGQRRSFF